jgi:predicted KAP-like P-loop ATPase
MMTQFKKTRELEIDSEAPWDDDVFKTLEGYATFLTNALIADPGPFVLNVNGAWGSGKTFFVKRWAADLRMQGYPVVEFNAWENDAEADPLTCLLAECISSLSEHLDKRTKVLQKLQEKGGRVAVSLGKIVTQAVMRRALGDDGAKGCTRSFLRNAHLLP